MNILLLYPEFPDTFWSFKYALKFVSKKAQYPPLGLLTVAAMLPQNWNKVLVDMNVERLRDSHIAWADYVFVSAMSVQSDSVNSVISTCKKAGVKTVAGGPLFTAYPEKFDDIDYLVLGEAEVTLPSFLEDLENNAAKHVYKSDERPELCRSPKPLWELIDIKKYSSMNVQYSRGCPFNCEFCEIVVLYGNKPRLKGTAQILRELDSLYDTGWRSSVFFVDDNFIGNKERLKNEVLPALIEWSKQKDHPFTFYTEASINLADDDELMRLMVEAGFDMVFIGIETPNEDSLTECNKNQNKNRDLLESVDKMQRRGLQVQGGFIIGFDNDPENIFDMMIRFIQQSGIVVAMVGLLNAPPGTRLFDRLKSENRILSDASGNNTDYSLNFEPVMPPDKLIAGYREVVDTVYSPENYYARVTRYLNKVKDTGGKAAVKLTRESLAAFFKAMFKIGIAGKERRFYWKLLLRTIFTCPSQLSKAVTFAIYGYHFRRIFRI